MLDKLLEVTNCGLSGNCDVLIPYFPFFWHLTSFHLSHRDNLGKQQDDDKSTFLYHEFWPEINLSPYKQEKLDIVIENRFSVCNQKSPPNFDELVCPSCKIFPIFRICITKIQSCEMSNLLHGANLPKQNLPQEKHINRDKFST